MTVYDIANEYSEKYRSISYPDRPSRPNRDDFPNHSLYGEALDEYEKKQSDHRDKLKIVQTAMGNIEAEFKAALAKELGLADHPKFDKLYSLAYEHGHSSGFSETAGYVNEFAELLRD